MKLRSKNSDKPRIEDELEKEDPSLVWKMQKSDQGYTFNNNNRIAPSQPVVQPIQTSITLRKNPMDQ